MELIFATGNSHKKEELARILTGHTILMPSDIGVEFDFEETGTTYLENSLGKAMHLHKLTGKAVIADDSGLSVDALEGAPGLYSARYGDDIQGRKISHDEKMDLVLEKMKGIENRSAFFVCCMSLVLSPWRHFTVQETMEGVIADKKLGAGGFGYDPIFFIPDQGLTSAEISSDIKNRISHRAKAGHGMLQILNGLKE